ncbi:MAG: WD40 repeat-containing protein [Comamonadaceae bacterium]|nr:MAG: WD40 repeat-containing protein [Comamonadaceae bacterium]
MGPAAICSVAWSTDGKTLASASDSGTVQLWDGANGKLLRTLEWHQGYVRSVAWSVDGKNLAVGSGSTVRLWDAASGKLLHILEGHQGSVRSVAWSADGKTLVIAGDDNTVRLWTVDGKEQLRMEAGEQPRPSLLNSNQVPGPREPGNWYALDFRQDPRGLWRGDGPLLDQLRYRDMGETPQPWPWLPRDWRATDVPELRAP